MLLLLAGSVPGHLLRLVHIQDLNDELYFFEGQARFEAMVEERVGI